MNIILNDSVVDNSSGVSVTRIKQEIDMLHEGVSPLFISKILKSAITIPVFRLYLLNDDESIRMDASEDLVSGDLSITYQTGQRRALNVTLMNVNNKWTPKPIVGLIYMGSKFRLDTGIVHNNTVYWKRQGIFVVQDPSYARNNSNQTISLSMCDKFGLLDGTVCGKSSLKTIIPAGINMEQAFRTILTTDRGGGMVYDSKRIVFSERHKNINTYFDIKQNYNENLGDVLIELGKSISCDVFYNEYGNLIVQSGCDDYASNALPIVYDFIEGERDIVSGSVKENWQKLRNSVTVKGAIVNGNQFTATIVNNVPHSPFSVSACRMELPEVIEDSKIYSDALCRDRAMYELIQYSRGVKSLSLTCNYIPHLDVNQMGLVNYESLNIEHSPFIIDSVSISLSSNAQTTVQMTNPKEACF